MPRTKNNDATNAAGFIRSQPRDMAAGEVVALGAKAGFKIRESYVHTIRYYERNAKAKSNGGGRLPAALKVASKPASVDGVALGTKVLVAKQSDPKRNGTYVIGESPSEVELKACILRVGTQRARILLEQIETSIAN